MALTHFRKGFFILLSATLLLSLLVEVNYLAYNQAKRWDLTRAGQHTLSTKTEAIIKELKQPVKITVLHVELPPKYLEDLLREYKRLSTGNIDFEIVDPISQIGYAAQFGQVIKGSEKKVIVQSGSERRDIDFTNEPLTENQINNALIRVSRPARHAYFLTGHGEYSLSQGKEKSVNKFSKLLLANRIITQNLILEITKKVPDDCDVLVIAGPQRQLPNSEVKMIQDYLEKGGDILILVENTVVSTPDVPLREDQMDLNPALDNLLNPWGIEVLKDVVVDLSSHASGDVGSPATNNYLSHKGIVSDVDFTFYIRPRTIKLLTDRRKQLKLAPLVLTSSAESSWGETDRYLNVKFDAGIDRGGPVTIAYVIFEEKLTQDRSDTRMIVFTDVDFLSDAYLDYYDNAKMGLNVVRWLTESDFQVFVDQEEIKVQKLDLASGQKRSVALILVLMPLGIIALGLGVWFKRKL